MGDAGNRIIAADNRCRSWREKLDLVRGLFAAGQPLDIEDLVDVAIYLRFLGTGRSVVMKMDAISAPRTTLVSRRKSRNGSHRLPWRRHPGSHAESILRFPLRHPRSFVPNR